MSGGVSERLAEEKLGNLQGVFSLLAKKVLDHRKDNHGLVPLQVFTSCLTIGGCYTCFEVLHRVKGEDNQSLGYALKKRDPSDQGWSGQWHIVGTVQRMTDDQGDVFRRLTTESFGEVSGDLLNPSDLEFLGIEIHFEPVRNATALTLIFRNKVRDGSLLKGNWKVFTDFDDPEIVDHHRRTLKWAEDPHRPVLNWSPIVIP